MTKQIQFTLLLVALVGLHAPLSVRADYFGKLEPRLIQVANGKKSDYKKPATSPKYVAIYFSALVSPLQGVHPKTCGVV